MMKMQRFVSYLLLTIYLVVMGHAMVPHHHHEKSFKDECCQEIVHEHQLAELCADSSSDHHNEQQAACHFDVRPVPGKSVVLGAYTLQAILLRHLIIPKDELSAWPEYRLPHISDPYLKTFALRGPPVFV
ncbi:DUF6769 family protein [Mangrovibacterium marinum]|uniref:Uncharacterized protein n=1 Tax=Mangrovibacterium marinum TaxID=1639118 RepID=A0A2T5C0Q0_9BACT|nr:DUF6769 family protein [Mangrovibacterium marinum]PTN08192.1 hypothetical protein C8N47_11078 [Mangrovibacterium marinum]